MNIYDFFHSADIAEHCRNINHQFSPLDMAAIIYLSDKPKEQQHEAYRQIIAEYPDMPIHRSLNFDARDSLHDYLRELIAYEERAIRAITEPENGAVFRASVCYYGTIGDVDGSYSTFEKAASAIREHWDWDGDKVEYAVIRKEHIDSFFRNREVTVDNKGNVFRVSYHEEGAPDLLDMHFFHLPVPFVKGDLVTFNDGKPYVLDWLPHWINDERRKYEDYIIGKRGDGSDMCATGYFMHEGELSRDNGPPYMIWQLSYYKGELKGEDRFLKYLSKYIKEKDESLDHLIAVYMKFYTEAQSEQFSKLFGGWYLPLEDEFEKPEEP